MAGTSILVPRGSPSCLLLLRGSVQDQQVGLTQASFELLPLNWVSVHVRFLCMSFKSGVSVFYNLLALPNMNTAVFQSSKFFGSSSQSRTLGMGSTGWGLHSSLFGEYICNFIIPLICRSSTRSVCPASLAVLPVFIQTNFTLLWKF